MQARRPPVDGEREQIARAARPSAVVEHPAARVRRDVDVAPHRQRHAKATLCVAHGSRVATAGGRPEEAQRHSGSGRAVAVVDLTFDLGARQRLDVERRLLRVDVPRGGVVRHAELEQIGRRQAGHAQQLGVDLADRHHARRQRAHAERRARGPRQRLGPRQGRIGATPEHHDGALTGGEDDVECRVLAPQHVLLPHHEATRRRAHDQPTDRRVTQHKAAAFVGRRAHRQRVRVARERDEFGADDGMTVAVAHASRQRGTVQEVDANVLGRPERARVRDRAACRVPRRAGSHFDVLAIGGHAGEAKETRAVAHALAERPSQLVVNRHRGRRNDAIEHVAHAAFERARLVLPSPRLLRREARCRQDDRQQCRSQRSCGSQGGPSLSPAPRTMDHSTTDRRAPPPAASGGRFLQRVVASVARTRPQPRDPCNLRDGSSRCARVWRGRRSSGRAAEQPLPTAASASAGIRRGRAREERHRRCFRLAA